MQNFRSCTKGLLITVLGLMMMLLGTHRGEIAILFTKAINICLECIGIG